MPDLLMDWHVWWLHFWDTNPALFWLAVIVAIALGIWRATQPRDMG